MSEICERLIEGNSLRSICSDPEMPSLATVASWMYNDKEFYEMYCRTKQMQAEVLADEIINLADEARTADFKFTNAYRLAVDTRKWAATKLLNNRYGDKVQQTHEVGDRLKSLIEEIDGRTLGPPALRDAQSDS